MNWDVLTPIWRHCNDLHLLDSALTQLSSAALSRRTRSPPMVRQANIALPQSNLVFEKKYVMPCLRALPSLKKNCSSLAHIWSLTVTFQGVYWLLLVYIMAKELHLPYGLSLIPAWISNHIHSKGWNFLSIPKLQQLHPSKCGNG